MARTKRPPKQTAPAAATAGSSSTASRAATNAAAAAPRAAPLPREQPARDEVIVGPGQKRKRAARYDNPAMPVYRTPRAKALEKFRDTHQKWDANKAASERIGVAYVVPEPVAPKVRKMRGGSKSNTLAHIVTISGNDLNPRERSNGDPLLPKG